MGSSKETKRHENSRRPMNILGISAYYHDSAAALVSDGRIRVAVQEERYTRKKHDARFPANAVRACLDEAGMKMADIDYVAFYDKPLLKFERLLETYLAFAPRGIESFSQAIPIWAKEKLFLKNEIRRELAAVDDLKRDELPPLLFNEHHLSHAAAAFFAGPFERAAVLCLDGVGEWATSSAWYGEGNELTPLWQISFPHSLGLLYSAFTYYTGFKVNSGEYKLMGLAPYGEPRYVQTIYDHLIDIKDDGSFRLNMRYFDYATGLRMTGRRFHALFGAPPKPPDGEVTQREMDLASSIQAVTEEIILRLARTLKRQTGASSLCLAGGVALNCVANGKLLESGVFDDLWAQPAAGDAGSAVGAALSAWHQHLGQPRHVRGGDLMQGAYLGPRFAMDEVKRFLDAQNARYTELRDEALLPEVASLLADGKVIGWFQGRMEFGPRALGNRSIIADPRSRTMQSTLNLKIKNRESFRPFAPAVKTENAAEWFDLERDSPYMMLVGKVRDEKRLARHEEESAVRGLDLLKIARSEIPAVTHVDYSARVQTVHKDSNPRFYQLLDCFEERTGCPILINTSFNVRGEPIVCTPEDAWRCFMHTEMDYLVIENCLLAKTDQGGAAPTAERAGGFEPAQNDAVNTADRALLRHFGLVLAGFIALAFGLLPLLFAAMSWRWPWAASVALAAAALAMPGLLKPLFVAWLFLGKWIGRINSKIIVTVLFFGMIFPIGCVRHLFADDPMRRRWNPDTASYLETNDQSCTQDMRRPY